jgi:hypothetical protein
MFHVPLPSEYSVSTGNFHGISLISKPKGSATGTDGINRGIGMYFGVTYDFVIYSLG